jgi:bifunctional DNA-binding transcriptional regulator/antitoxin component of YhaV-PrlF toxin-antitoxin module
MTAKLPTPIVRPQANGQITLPAEFRARLGIDQDTFLQLTLRGTTIEVSPVRLTGDSAQLREYDSGQLEAFLREDKIDRKTAARVRRLLAGG